MKQNAAEWPMAQYRPPALFDSQGDDDVWRPFLRAAHYGMYVLTLLCTNSSFRSFQKEGDEGGERATNTMDDGCRRFSLLSFPLTLKSRETDLDPAKST
jgi:hypothetical protein